MSTETKIEKNRLRWNHKVLDVIKDMRLTEKFSFFFLIIMIFLAAFAPWAAPFDPEEIDIDARNQFFTAGHIMGTDNFGRDVLSRIVHGGRISITVGVVAMVLATALGMVIGTVSGYFPRLDDPIMRATDILLAFPPLLLAIGLMTVVRPGLWNIIVVLGIVYSPRFARVIRSIVLSVKEMDYVTAAKVTGERDFKIIFKEILPNCFTSMIVLSMIFAGFAIIDEAALSYLGLGIPPPQPSWGRMINEAQMILVRAPWNIIYPGVIIVLTIFSFNIMGNWLRRKLEIRIERF